MDNGKAAQRQKQYKTTVEASDFRKRSQNARVSIRKQRREQNMLKRRAMVDDFDNEVNQPAEELKSLDEYNRMIHSTEIPVLIEGVRGIRQLLSIEYDPPINDVLRLGCVPRLIQFMARGDCTKLQFEAAWALTNVASGTSEQTFELLKLGAVPAFVQAISSPDAAVKEQAVWALGNIAGDSSQCRNYVLAQSVMPYLLELTNENVKTSLRRNTTWTISNLFRGKPAPALQNVQPAVAPLVQLLKSSDTQVAVDACWALSYFSDGDNLKIQILLEAGACPLLVGLLMHANRSVQTPALRVIGNIVTGDDFQTQAAIDDGVVARLKYLLNTSNSLAIQKEVCWTLSNITAGSAKQVQHLINAGLIPILVNILNHGDFDVMKEAAWAIANATSSGTGEQIRFLVANGCIKPLCKLLFAPDHRIVSVSLEALENILLHGESLKPANNGVNTYARIIVESPEGLDKILALRMHPNDGIVDKAETLVDLYFDNEVEENDDVAPAVSADGSSYAFGTGAAQPGAFMF